MLPEMTGKYFYLWKIFGTFTTGIINISDDRVVAGGPEMRTVQFHNCSVQTFPIHVTFSYRKDTDDLILNRKDLIQTET